jgi:hypothetical protein
MNRTQPSRLLRSVILFISIISTSHISLSQARSTQVVFTNNTSFVMYYNTANLGHGIWSIQAPQIIMPNATVSWKTESNGAGTGTEGVINYILKDPNNNNAVISGEVIIHWINPFVGSNSLNFSRPYGFNLISSGNNGNNCIVYITLQQVGQVTYKPRLVLPHDRIYSLSVRVKTSSNYRSGTDNDVYFSIGPLTWKLNGTFEVGNNEIFNLDISNCIVHTDDIVFLQLEKKGLGGYHGTTDFPDGEWEVEYVELFVNGAPYLGRPVNRVLSSPQAPFWREIIQDYKASDPSILFFNTLRLTPNNSFVKGQDIACKTTYLAKLKGISGWLQNNLPYVYATGRVLWLPSFSSDGLATIDIEISQISFGNDTRYFSIYRPSFIRIEFLTQNECVSGIPSTNDLNWMRDQMIQNGVLPNANTFINVQGLALWDTDEGGHYEIHGMPGCIQILQ